MGAKLKLESGLEIDFYYTDDVDEMIRFGKVIYDNSPKRYPSQLVERMKHTIRHWLPNSTDGEVNDLVYRSIYDFWAYGAKIEEEFFFDLLNKTHDEKKEFINYMEHIVYAFKINNREHKDILYHKYMAYRYFKEYYKRDVILINGDEDEFDKFKGFALKHSSFIVKPVDSHMADGVYIDHLEKTTEGEIQKAFKRICDACKDNLNSRIASKAGAVVEELFVQDERMNVLHTPGVNHIRVTTIRTGEKVDIFNVWLCVGRDNNLITPYAQGLIMCCVDKNTGIVETDGHTELGETFVKHPNTGITLKGFQIPDYKDLIAISQEAARTLHDIRYVGWDFVLSNKGWCVQEANFAGEPDWQLVYKVGSKKEFEEAIGWNLTKEFWWQEDVKAFH